MIAAMNPIMARELRERMRSMRAPIILSVYLMVLGLIVFITERSLAREEVAAIFEAASAGRTVFHTLTFFLVLFLCFMVPAFTASAISSERERQTLHLVQVTMLRARSIVLGKLGAAAAYLGLLVVATLPLVGISFLLGGVTAWDVIRAYGIILFVGLTLALVGIGLSARTRRTVASTVLAFGFVGLMTIGSLIGYTVVRALQFSDGEAEAPPTWILVLNPFSAPATIIGDRNSGSPSPWDGMASMLNDESRIAREAVLRDGGARGVVPFGNVAGDASPYWVKSVIAYGVLDVAAFLFAVGGVRAPAARIKVGRRRKGAVTEGP